MNVFHHRHHHTIIGVTWLDPVTNVEVLKRTEQRAMQDIIKERRLQFAGHTL